MNVSAIAGRAAAVGAHVRASLLPSQSLNEGEKNRLSPFLCAHVCTVMYVLERKKKMEGREREGRGRGIGWYGG